MNTETLTALQGSIKKWEDIRDGTGGDMGRHNCPLCELYYTFDPYIASTCCSGCPVFEKTNQIWCHGTPYERWSKLESALIDEAYDNPHGVMDHIDSNKARQIAQDEVDFLKSLLPDPIF